MNASAFEGRPFAAALCAALTIVAGADRAAIIVYLKSLQPIRD